MEKFYIVLLFFGLSMSGVMAQTSAPDDEAEDKSALTIGILQGGGSLIGADFETLLTPQFGVQLGAGLVGAGAGLNVHFKPSVRSSFISLQYWHQGFGSSFAQSVLSANFVYRSKKWFTAQIGVGAPLDRDPAFAEQVDHTPVILTYAIGGYFSF